MKHGTVMINDLTTSIEKYITKLKGKISELDLISRRL